jgi:hypothetical protein
LKKVRRPTIDSLHVVVVLGGKQLASVLCFALYGIQKSQNNPAAIQNLWSVADRALMSTRFWSLCLTFAFGVGGLVLCRVAIVLIVVVWLTSTLSYYQEGQSAKVMNSFAVSSSDHHHHHYHPPQRPLHRDVTTLLTLLAPRQNMMSETARVRRNGKEIDVPTEVRARTQSLLRRI